MKKNNWRTAFFALLVVFIATTLFLIYSILDQGVTITYMKEGYRDTESDLEQLSKVIEGRLTLDDFKGNVDPELQMVDSTTIELNRVTITFGTDKKVKGVMTRW
ncbi:MAG: hypothetical protein AB7K37_16885 [Cyclobacteriaceae bacterium]